MIRVEFEVPALQSIAYWKLLISTHNFQDFHAQTYVKKCILN